MNLPQERISDLFLISSHLQGHFFSVRDFRIQSLSRQMITLLQDLECQTNGRAIIKSISQHDSTIRSFLLKERIQCMHFLLATRTMSMLAFQSHIPQWKVRWPILRLSQIFTSRMSSPLPDAVGQKNFQGLNSKVLTAEWIPFSILPYIIRLLLLSSILMPASLMITRSSRPGIHIGPFILYIILLIQGQGIM